MGSERLRLVAVCAFCVLAAFTASHAAMSGLARLVEVDQNGYLWRSEEWLQLLVPSNFVDRGDGRIMLTGSSEGREGFLSDVFEAELPDFDVYNNSYSNHTLGTLLLVLEYLEQEYGPGAMPEKLVIGTTPWFLLDDPSNDESFFPMVTNIYTPSFVMDVSTAPPALVSKGALQSIASRARFLTHQSRRYRGAVSGALRAGVLAFDPDADSRYSLRKYVVPSMYHDLAPMDQREQLQSLRDAPRASADPRERLDNLRLEFGHLLDIAARHDIELYVVNMPQSTWMIDEYFGSSYELYLEELTRLVDGLPFLDLSRFLQDSDYYDMLHADLEAAERLSRRVAGFVRDTAGGR